jgi:hypothetical protein
MLFNQNLESIIFDRHKTHESDELIVLSGYLGPSPVKMLKELPFNSSVIYGMYGEKGIQKSLHNALLKHQKEIDSVNIYYSNIAIHSKCYIWKKQKNISHALIGSANFSTNGLCTPYREILTETDPDTYTFLSSYIDRIMMNSVLCTDIILPEKEVGIEHPSGIQISSKFCRVTLLDKSGNVPSASGLNWGHGKGNVTINDAYLGIKMAHIDNYPHLFPPIQDYTPMLSKGLRAQRINDQVEIIWDDGIIMGGLLEAKQTKKNGVDYPKNFSSSPRKNIMGEYIRARLGVTLGTRVTLADLEQYGRTHIDISLQNEGVYSFDFSV